MWNEWGSIKRCSTPLPLPTPLSSTSSRQYCCRLCVFFAVCTRTFGHYLNITTISMLDIPLWSIEILYFSFITKYTCLCLRVCFELTAHCLLASVSLCLCECVCCLSRIRAAHKKWQFEIYAAYGSLMNIQQTINTHTHIKIFSWPKTMSSIRPMTIIANI